MKSKKILSGSMVKVSNMKMFLMATIISAMALSKNSAI